MGDQDFHWQPSVPQDVCGLSTNNVDFLALTNLSKIAIDIKIVVATNPNDAAFIEI